MSNADGIHKKLKKNNDSSNSMKCNLMEKRDIIDAFRYKYSWYFKAKYNFGPPKKKNFDDIMEMSSVWTNASQM